uniref:Seipin n=1 Tax=Phallusia mammillata TaxID=59560 RepID=A0A6F9D795_9ASCI|nr:seipin [Phallusia mammillata]
MSFFSFVAGFIDLVNTYLIKPVKEFIWNKFEPHYDISKKVAIGFLIVFNIICISICLSAFMFGVIYFYHMPTVYHTFPLDFIYNRSCIENHKIYQTNARWFPNLYREECFPQAQILLSSPKDLNLLQEGQPYGVVIHLQAPETTINKEIGMFMIQMKVNGQSITESKPKGTPEPETDRPNNSWFYGKYNPQPTMHFKQVEKSTALHYTSTVIRYLKLIFFWPLHVFDFIEEVQSIDVVLFDELLLEKENFVWKSVIQLDHPAIMVKSAHIDFTAKFKGIQYFLYHWPVASFIAGTSVFFLPMFFFVSMFVYICIWRQLFSVQIPAQAAVRRGTRQQNAVPPTLTHADIQPARMPSGTGNNEIVGVPGGLQLENLNPIADLSRRSSSSSIEMLGQSHSPEVQDEITSSQISYVMTPSIHGSLQTEPPNAESISGEFSQAEENGLPEMDGQLRLRRTPQN